jgi:hypothetical protein
MSALDRYLASPQQGVSRGAQSLAATPRSSAFGSSPSGNTQLRATPTPQETPSQVGGGGENGFIPLRPPPHHHRRSNWSDTDGPPPAQPRMRPHRDSEAIPGTPGSVHGSVHGQQEDEDNDPFFFVQGVQVTPQTKRRRRGVARSVCQTFGLPEQSLDRYSEVLVVFLPFLPV